MKKRYVGILILIVGFLALLFWWQQAILPVSQKNTGTTFVIAKGDDVRSIARKLKEEGFIRDQIAFFLLVKKLGIEKNIQAGSYKLSPNLTAEQVAKALTTGTEDVWITIPEGWRVEQIVDFLESKGFSGMYLKMKEGQYFPDTYLVPKESSISSVLDLMQSNFTKKALNVTNDQLVVASLIEREAKTKDERPLIASVIYNRLKIGMVLNIDATIQYAIGKTKDDGWWKKELTEADLKFISPYNTYINAGLPPTPICNPGLASIEAAISPAKSDYLYYVTGTDGITRFAKTLPEHNLNVAKYLK